MSARRSSAFAISAGGTSFASRKPSGALRSDHRADSARQRARETVTASPSIAASSSARWRQRSGRKVPFLSSNIERLLEGSRADTAAGVRELLAVAPQSEVDVDQAIDGGGDFVRRHRRADDGAQCRVGAVAAADRDLIGFRSVLFQTENADVADMVMAAGIDAARDLDLKRPDVLLALGEVGRQRLRDGNRACGGEAAVIQAGAADDVAGETDIGGGEPGRGQPQPQIVECRLAHMRQDHVLVMGYPDLTEAQPFGELGQQFHLAGTAIAGHLAV